MVETLTAIRALLEVRLELYDLLRQTFLREPAREFLVDMKANLFPNNFPFVDENASLAQGADEVHSYLAENDPSDPAVYDAIHWDYTRLFIGPDRLSCPPWESAYRNEDHLLFQAETLAVRRAYLEYTFLPVEFGIEADDHLGLELDFLFRLTELALEALEAGEHGRLRQILTDQRRFLDEHLLRWGPALCEDIILNADTGVYRGMARILSGFMPLDRQALEELLASDY